MFISDPGDSRPALLIGGSDRIVVTHLNGSGLQPLRSLRINGTLALDFQQNQESVCWVLSSESSGQLRCAVTRSLRGFTREQEIRTQQSLQRMFISVPSFVHFSDKQPSNHTNKRYSCLWRASSGAHASLFSHCTLLSPSLSYLRALSLYLLIITEAYDRLASAVLEFIFILQSPFRPASCTRCTRCTRCAASEVLPFSALVKIPMNYSPFHNKCARLSFVKVS